MIIIMMMMMMKMMMMMVVIIKAVYDVWMLRKLATQGGKPSLLCCFTGTQHLNTKKVITS